MQRCHGQAERAERRLGAGDPAHLTPRWRPAERRSLGSSSLVARTFPMRRRRAAVGRCVEPVADPYPSLHRPHTDARMVCPAKGNGNHIAITVCAMGFTATVRAPAGEQVGGTGATLVKAAFERLGWGVAVNPEHDLGTDLFVMARDERRFDLGQAVGVQVKAGRRYFRYQSRRDGIVVGWWFRDDNLAHVDAWLSHALPHLIVLHDPVSEQSYWAHVTQDTVLPAGK